jgi:glycosyltransferase involved in cell wall biosynthesis
MAEQRRKDGAMSVRSESNARDHDSISVVIATRDRPELLRRAVRAVVEQDHPGLVEVIIVFDRSEPDMSLSWSDGRRSVRVLTNERTPGLAGSRNTGALHAIGDWVAFCDDDDEWLPGKVAAQMSMLADHPQAEVATTGIVVDYDGKLIPRVIRQPQLTFQDLLRSRNMAAHPSTVMVHRGLFLSVIGLVDEHIPGSYAEDYEWLLRAARTAAVVCVPEPLVRVLWHRSSFFTGRWQMIIDALTYLLDAYPEFADEPRGEARILGQIAFAHAALGNAREARRVARQALSRNPLERRAYLAAAVSMHAVSPGAVQRTAHAFGRGI